MNANTITIALSKGRILKETLPLLAEAGIEPTEDLDTTRKLIIGTTREDVSLVIIRAADVPTYVQYGAADIGVSGKDVLMEHGGEGLYEPLDLKIAECKLMVAGMKGAQANAGARGRRLRIATKYLNIARRYYAEKGEQVELIKLYGSMELGPIVGLSDLIVDLVDTGNTLKANGLEPLEHIADISSRLVVNRASMKMKYTEITHLTEQLAAAVESRHG